MVYENNDTIVAISTPPGEGGIGIVRLSGPKALIYGLSNFVLGKRKKKIEKFNPEPRRLYYGFMVDDGGNEIDEVLLSYMPAPHSYTCEDVVEINAHGGIIPLKKILELMQEKGARMAEPGEFTKRAYLNGRIDLIQAESTLSLIRAKTEKALNAAIQSLKGALSKEIKEIREKLFEVMADIEAEIDFQHEDVELELRIFGDVVERLKAIRLKVNYLLERRMQGKILQEGLKTVIIGKPNVGKSSLYNLIIGEERAIVTDLPGTTRDLLIDYINLKGVPLKIIDTAGLRREGDLVEQKGMQFSRKAIEEADLIIFMLDAGTGITQEDRWIFESLPQKEEKVIIIVLNKIDLERKISLEEIKKNFACDSVVETSIIKNIGMEKLEDAILEKAYSGRIKGEEGLVILEVRQEELLSRASQLIGEALQALETGLPLDLITIDLNQAQKALGELLGEEFSEELLDYVFKRFCIGK